MTVRFRVSLLEVWLAILLAGLLRSVSAEGMTPVEDLQLQACRATSSLLLLHGEGFRDKHLEQLEGDTQAFKQAMRELAPSSETLQDKHRELLDQLRSGLGSAKAGKPLSTEQIAALGSALREFLGETRAQPGGHPPAELPVQIEYLAVQYLSRAYGSPFPRRQRPTINYIGQDEDQLIASIDAQLQALAEPRTPGIEKLLQRWKYLQAALRGSTGEARPLAPLVVSHHARALTDQWLELYQWGQEEEQGQEQEEPEQVPEP